MPDFDLYPALDLRDGRVIRLQEGDPERQIVYDLDPPNIALRWLEAGAQWLHVVNLDGVFGQPDEHNQAALDAILEVAGELHARIQFGGGIRSLAAIRLALHMGVSRVVLGTVAVEQPQILYQALVEFGPQQVAVAIDARNGLVRVRGWQTSTNLEAVTLAEQLAYNGVKWAIFTDVARDGMSTGLNLKSSQELARRSGLKIIAAGGLRNLEEVKSAQQAGLSGVIVGRSLYEGQLDLASWFHASDSSHLSI